MKIIIGFAFIIILASLASALYFMMRHKGDPRHMARALTVRISVSVLLFIAILVAHYFGLIQSTGLR
jgi:predicted PurR-regulated permease PerM